MAMVGAVLSLFGMGEQKKAARQAKEAGVEGARSIMRETATNIEQTRKSQSQTLGFTKAAIAASGIKFDARKINAVRFSEGGMKTGSAADNEWEAGRIGTTNFTLGEMLIGGSSFYEKEGTKDVYSASDDYANQISGDMFGSSSFNYLRQMKKNFAQDIGWQAKQGVSRAKVAQLGGQVAYAQGRASTFKAAGSLASNAYNMWRKPQKTAPQKTAPQKDNSPRMKQQ